MMQKDAAALRPKSLERVEDLVRLWSRLDPAWLVHTKADVTEGEYCPHLLTSSRPVSASWAVGLGVSRGPCMGLDPRAPRARLADDTVAVAKHAALWWDGNKEPSLREEALEGPRSRPLRASTPGFILQSAGALEVAIGAGRGASFKIEEVFFLSLDGGIYRVLLDDLAVGAPPVAAWPKDVQHVLVDTAVLEGAFGDGLPVSAPEPLHAAFVAQRAKLSSCAATVWAPAAEKVLANDTANITETTREKRARKIEKDFVALARKKCRPHLIALAAAYGAVLDARTADRVKIYEAAKQRFAR